ncbi:type I-E CRISPR-associated protein Cse2/CasB [bacterium]|nr:type I-E CRISPR-associated protein Cse2/CasB [bacterium]
MKDEQFDVIQRWWGDLNNARELRKKGSPFTTADSALLRRSKSSDEVIFNCPAYHNLCERVAFDERPGDKRLAIVAAVLSHVRHDDLKKTIPFSLKALSVKSDAVNLRFKRLAQISNPDELQLALIRTVKLVGETANVRHLARSIWYWGDAKTKMDWAYDFY